ncbi:MAG TPA: small multi-drug export protein [Lachnospiraceae bacterium]|nr:small multi-drug export protein [Lachnospiraceae bacterium]
MTNAVAVWFANNLGHLMPAELVCFIVSLFPILECRGGLIVAKLLGVNLLTALPICIIGNILPVPFILLLLNKIFQFFKRTKHHKLVDKIEAHAMKKSESLSRGEFLGLLLFVGIPLPGTGAWTGSMIAALLGMDRRRSSVAIGLGVLLAAFIISVIFYGLLGGVIH